MVMCRNIKTLHNFDPPATDEEIYLSSLQFVRKLSGFTRPSQANQAAFNRAAVTIEINEKGTSLPLTVPRGTVLMTRESNPLAIVAE